MTGGPPVAPLASFYATSIENLLEGTSSLHLSGSIFFPVLISSLLFSPTSKLRLDLLRSALTRGTDQFLLVRIHTKEKGDDPRRRQRYRTETHHLAMPFTAASLSPFPTAFPSKRHHFLFPSVPVTSRRLPIPASLLSSETLLQFDHQLEPDDPHQAPDYNSLDTWTERDMRSLPSPELEVIRLEDLPEQWRLARIAWLCKELPAYKQPTVVRILNGQRKWISQGDATYVAVHCMRVREYESAFRVYSWMSQQCWYQFNFALATKLADHLGKDRKIAKCREVFDDITKQGRVASESTFHIFIIAYLSAPVDGGVDEACTIYNQMVKQGGYRPRLTLHNSMFKAHFNFFATQFRVNSQPAVPKLIHRWLSPCVLAYWYMYAGFKHSSGDILLRLKGGKIEDVERIVKSLKEKSILCKVKSKGRVSWIGMQGSSADTFLKLVEPYLLDFCEKDDDSQIKEINFGYPDADSEVD